MRNETTYNQIVGITEGGEIIVLDDTFHYEDGFKGATYYSMNVLTQEQIDEYNDDEAVLDYCRDYANCIKKNLKDNKYYIFDDTSFRYEMDEAYDKLDDKSRAMFDKAVGVKGEEFVDWQIEGCGRIGNSYKEWKFKVLINPELISVIEEAEA